MDGATIFNIILVVVVVGLSLAGAFFTFKSTRSLDRLETLIEKEPDKRIKLKSINLSEKYENYVKTFTSNMSYMMYRHFTDNRELEKITKSQIHNLVKEVSESVYMDLRIKDVDMDRMLYSREYIDKLIVNTAEISIKDLLIKSIISITEE